MTTYNITHSLLNNVARTNAIIAMSNSTTTTISNSIIIYSLIALVVAFAGFGAWVIWDTWYR